MDPDNTAELLGIDPASSADPLELQVFTTVAAGESTPSSARVGWGGGGAEAVLAPASGIYVLDLQKARREALEAATESVATSHEDANMVGDTIGPVVLDEPPNKTKFRSNPLAANPLVVTSPFGPRTYKGKTNQPHLGVDLRADQGTPIFAVEDGVVRLSGIEEGKAGWAIKIVCDNGYTVRYHHCDADLSAGVVSENQRVVAGQKVGYSGGTKGTAGAGSSEDPHLHFMARPSEKAGQANNVDPVPLLPGPVTGKGQQKKPTKSTS
jgi:murein DD-endopeptidase MepM/ murein hydrolase activator NlpD